MIKLSYENKRKLVLGIGIGLIVLCSFAFLVLFTGLIKPIRYFLLGTFGLFAYLLRSRSMGSFFLLGVCNGILPCGIVYYFLLSAVASGSAMGGAVVMGIFGVASALVMFAFALFASSLMRVLKPAFFNTLAGLCMVGYGGYGVFSNLALL